MILLTARVRAPCLTAVNVTISSGSAVSYSGKKPSYNGLGKPCLCSNYYACLCYYIS
ncbi:hypothetical protein [Methanosarcina sp.]|uniref:hypothetical protein n=1 Tax=Methanosarcina sp. TaxID=2213 RepID=UPI002ABCE6A3|nr:hypothetical protein [Methanosarcina sp.]MDY9925916.1 hypothetical protein [Methanosarcina sp.]